MDPHAVIVAESDHEADTAYESDLGDASQSGPPPCEVALAGPPVDPRTGSVHHPATLFGGGRPSLV